LSLRNGAGRYLITGDFRISKAASRFQEVLTAAINEEDR